MTKRDETSLETEIIVVQGVQRIIGLEKKTEGDTLGCVKILLFMLSNFTNFWTALRITHFRCFASGSICLVQRDLYSHVHTILFNMRRLALSLFT